MQYVGIGDHNKDEAQGVKHVEKKAVTPALGVYFGKEFVETDSMTAIKAHATMGLV